MSILIDLHSVNRGANGLLSGLSVYQLQGLSAYPGLWSRGNRTRLCITYVWL